MFPHLLLLFYKINNVVGSIETISQHILLTILLFYIPNPLPEPHCQKYQYGDKPNEFKDIHILIVYIAFLL